MSNVSLGFIPEPVLVKFEKILPSRKLPENINVSRKYKQVLESIRAIGLIEPLTICSATTDSGMHILLDGHTRLHAMRTLGLSESQCLIATDDETYTYNNRVNRLSTVQEHLMIKRAINRGVSPEKLAKSLNIDLGNIMRKVRLLDGVCTEAADLLRDQIFSIKIGGILKKMKPTRQIECVELMLSANNITVTYAEALLAASPASLLTNEFAPKKVRGVSAEQMNKMEREMGNLQEQYKLVEDSYGQDVLNLVLAKGFLIKMLDNPTISRYIKQFQPDVYTEFSNIVNNTSLEK
ncbi:chromosome partitioning protein ParB [Limnohabitans sp. MORI2]|uniref:plasmid partitioning protein RepB C-terminal domain-containing protein n=1 Tax=Limnohabitans sp. MORI2 TaxID=1751150 RepID=UPI002377B1C7|nr:plasmid partitioning protein RepB C-terminal domain-containing protein [Limnohabitans sp. MORI2]BDU57934.1 chromosome partitioning protein ParB [Limnohabitans sp. MORI2]